MLRVNSLVYRDDNAAELRLNFGEHLVFIISVPVSVRIEGDVPEEEAEALEDLRKTFETKVTRQIDLTLFDICLEVINATASTKEASA